MVVRQMTAYITGAFVYSDTSSALPRNSPQPPNSRVFKMQIDIVGACSFSTIFIKEVSRCTAFIL